MDIKYQRYPDIRDGCVDVISIGSRRKVLYGDEASQGECMKPFARTRIPDNPSSASQDRPEVRFHLGFANICAEE